MNFLQRIFSDELRISRALTFLFYIFMQQLFYCSMWAFLSYEFFINVSVDTGDSCFVVIFYYDFLNFFVEHTSLSRSFSAHFFKTVEHLCLLFIPTHQSCILCFTCTLTNFFHLMRSKIKKSRSDFLAQQVFFPKNADVIVAFS